MKKKVRLGLIAAFGLICIIATVVYVLKPLDVDTFITTSEDVYDYVAEDGAVVSDQAITVSAKTASQVSEIYFENGDRVSEGDLLLKLDAEDMTSQIEQVSHQITAASEAKNLNLVSLKYQISQQKIVVDQMESQVSNAKDALDRSEVLYEAGSLSDTDIKDARLSYDSLVSTQRQNQTALNSLQAQYNDILSANGNVAALEAQLDALSLTLKNSEVYANASGILTDFDLHVGDYVMPSIPIASIINPDLYKVETYVLTEDAYNLSVGDAVVLEIKRNGETLNYDGTIYSVAPNAVETVSALGLVEKRVKVLVNAGDLTADVKVGYDVKVKFISEFQLDAVAIPKTSVFYIADDAYVFKKVNGKAVMTKITTTMETDSDVVVSDGVFAGDELVKNYKISGLAEGKRID